MVYNGKSYQNDLGVPHFKKPLNSSRSNHTFSVSLAFTSTVCGPWRKVTHDTAAPIWVVWDHYHRKVGKYWNMVEHNGTLMKMGENG